MTKTQNSKRLFGKFEFRIWNLFRISKLGFRIFEAESQWGQSIIEVIVAVAIFIIIASSSVVAVLGSLSTTRLAEEETQATLFASEGMEAVQSIRNQDWDNLTNGDHGLSNSGGIWSFSGTSDVDPSEKFTRVITVEDVQRDGNSDIVNSGGTVDQDTKKVSVAVSWNFTPTRSNTVSKVLYLTNWQTGRSVGAVATPAPTPTPGGPSTCVELCTNNGYSAGTCRANAQQCNNNGETHESGGDQFCTGGASADRCCCAP